MKKYLVIFLGILLLFIILFFSCRGGKEEQLQTIKDPASMVENAYYIGRSDGSYTPLFFPSMNVRKGQASSSVSKNRVAFFREEDFRKIPVMQKGEFLYYYSKEHMDSDIVIERFRSYGYSFGLCGLKKKVGERYSFNSTSNQMNIFIKSSAADLLNLSASSVILDAIGSTPLRSGNVSEIGSVTGLVKGKSYKVHCYLGTQDNIFNLKSDTLLYGQFEATRIKNYEYTKSNTIRFSFPESFHSGYYYVDGFGFVKYLAKPDDSDMEAPNPYEKQGKEDISQKKITANADDKKEEIIHLDENKKVTILLHYDTGESSLAKEYFTPPSAKLIGESLSYTFVQKEDGLLSLSAELAAGDYRLQIEDLLGRSYRYELE